MAVTRSGIPIRVWTWPGNTGDSTLIRQVKDDLRAWKLTRVVWVADRGFSSEENRRYLQRAGGHYIIGEKLRGDYRGARRGVGPPGPLPARGRQPGSQRGRHRRRHDARPVHHLPQPRPGRPRPHRARPAPHPARRPDRRQRHPRPPTPGRPRRPPPHQARLPPIPAQTSGGLLRIDRGAVAAEERLDGKFLLRTSDPTLTAEDVAVGYKQLLEVERGWRDMKSTLDLRPVYHHLERRIRAHIVLCWLALLLIRLTETATSDTWRNLRHELDRMHLVTFTGPHGTVRQRTATTAGQARILPALDLAEPPRFTQLTPACQRRRLTRGRPKAHVPLVTRPNLGLRAFEHVRPHFQATPPNTTAEAGHTYFAPKNPVA